MAWFICKDSMAASFGCFQNCLAHPLLAFRLRLLPVFNVNNYFTSLKRSVFNKRSRPKELKKLTSCKLQIFILDTPHWDSIDL
jgi:hypothetical protein